MKTKKFALRDILTVTTGRLLTKSKGPRNNGIGDLYEILEWMTDDSASTHQLGRFSEECKPWLLRWFPELAAVDDLLPELDAAMDANKLPYETNQYDEIDRQIIDPWLDTVMAKAGCKAEYDVPRIPRDDHDRINPLDELVAMLGTDEGIIVAEIPGEQG